MNDITRSLACPVCAAQQTASDTCRRCRADLSLVNAAQRNIALATVSTLVHLASGDLHAASLSLTHQRWIAPNKAAALQRLLATNPPTRSH